MECDELFELAMKRIGQLMDEIGPMDSGQAVTAAKALVSCATMVIAKRSGNSVTCPNHLVREVVDNLMANLIREFD